MPLTSTFIILTKFIILIQQIHLSPKLELVNRLVDVIKQFIHYFLKPFLLFIFQPTIFVIFK